jgi:hypothetical protein
MLSQDADFRACASTAVLSVRRGRDSQLRALRLWTWGARILESELERSIAAGSMHEGDVTEGGLGVTRGRDRKADLTVALRDG